MKGNREDVPAPVVGQCPRHIGLVMQTRFVQRLARTERVADPVYLGRGLLKVRQQWATPCGVPAAAPSRRTRRVSRVGGDKLQYQPSASVFPSGAVIDRSMDGLDPPSPS